MSLLPALDRNLSRLTRPRILALAVLGVCLVGYSHYLVGYELSMSLFYVGPVALAAWYVGRGGGIAIAVLSCASWFTADYASGNLYSHPAIPVWNSLVRLGFFLICGLLLTVLRNALSNERHLARTDALTGLYGRRAFEEKLEHDLALAQRHNSAVTLAYIDLDDFKAVNDNHGHQTGDRVLAVTGTVMRTLLRRVDTAARLGGDEFALVLPDTDQQGARQAIEHLRGDLQRAFQALGLEVSCSIGAVTFPSPNLTSAEAIAAADALMYEVKRRGKGAADYREHTIAATAVRVGATDP